MDRAKPAFLSTLISLFLSVSISSSTHPQRQTLILTSLPKPTQTGHSTLTQLHSETGIKSEHNFGNIASLDFFHVLNHPSTFGLAPELLFKHRIERDRNRVHTIQSLASGSRGGDKHRPRDYNSSVFSGLDQGSGEYFTRIGVGTPLKYLDMVLDTGSDIVWLQCSPCRKCYNQTDPIFNPRNSRSFSRVACGSKLCRRLDSPGCGTRHKNTCTYEVRYGDDSFTRGELSTETLSFRGNRVKRVALGCGNDNEGLFSGAGGLLGLGRGKLSFTTQAARRFGKKFSYCMVDLFDPTNSSFILFGESAVSRKSVFTPLLTNPKMSTFYYVGLNGISVGGLRVGRIKPSVFKLDSYGRGGVIVDSGTSVTRLAEPAYKALRDAFRNKTSKLKRISPSPLPLFDTCFDFSGNAEMEVPSLVLHFTDVDVSLPAKNYLIPVDNNGTFCFAFAGTTGRLSIIGNIQQQGFRVSFDLERNRVGFAPNSCG